MQQLTCRMDWSFSVYSLKRALILRKGSPGGKILRKCEKRGKVWKIGDASLFTKFLFTIFAPLNPPPSQPAK